MITTIDHSVRETLNISSVHYMIVHTCAQYFPLLKPTGVGDLSDVLGLSSRAVSVAVNDLITCSPPLLEKKENGHLYPTIHWYMAHEGEEVTLTTEHDELAKEVIKVFNVINWTKYQIPTNMELVKRVLKQNPKLTLEHFKSVILHKKVTWGEDEKMKEYNRPSTIFSGKFMRYLDDANHYWIKQRNDSTTTLFGD